MNKVDAKEVIDSIYDAQKYSGALSLLDKELRTAEKQILSSAEATEKEIDAVFKSLSDKVVRALEKRRCALLEKTRKIRDQGLQPLRSSQAMIGRKLQETRSFIELGRQIDALNFDEFSRKSSLLGSLPEVPELKEVSYITFQCDANVQAQLSELCSSLGSVSRIAPVQIFSLVAKPGAILVEWETLDSDEPYVEIQEYQLERAFGNSRSDDGVVFHSCYQGPELQHLVQDLKPHQEYSFRVRCKFEGRSEHSPWSVVQVGSTAIEPYCWRETPDFALSNERKIATSLRDGATVLSEGPQFRTGNTLDFTFVGVGEKLKETFIGLVQMEKANVEGFELDVKNDGTFLLEASGEVYVDGTLKATRLPPIRLGSKVSFTCTAIGDEKIRLNIDVSDKRVTYDWNTDVGNVYFVGRFAAPNWKVLVE